MSFDYGHNSFCGWLRPDVIHTYSLKNSRNAILITNKCFDSRQTWNTFLSFEREHFSCCYKLKIIYLTFSSQLRFSNEIMFLPDVDCNQRYDIAVHSLKDKTNVFSLFAESLMIIFTTLTYLNIQKPYFVRVFWCSLKKKEKNSIAFDAQSTIENFQLINDFSLAAHGDYDHFRWNENPPYIQWFLLLPHTCLLFSIYIANRSRCTHFHNRIFRMLRRNQREHVYGPRCKYFSSLPSTR